MRRAVQKRRVCAAASSTALQLISYYRSQLVAKLQHPSTTSEQIKLQIKSVDRYLWRGEPLDELHKRPESAEVAQPEVIVTADTVADFASTHAVFAARPDRGKPWSPVTIASPSGVREAGL